jgi:hypothetical protein
MYIPSKERLMFPFIPVWTTRLGQEKAAIAVLKRLATQVEAQEDFVKRHKRSTPKKSKQEKL